MTSHNRQEPSVIAQLRAIVPARPLKLWEANRIAETQASKLRSLLNATGHRFDTDLIATLPRVRVQHRPTLRASGSSQWRDGLWRISINPIEAEVRQRFTICHETKHVIDAPIADHAYRQLAKRYDGQRQIEAVCDHFAANLLMPKPLVKRLWGQGNRQLDALAATFDVSTAAMRRRLEHLGLVEPRPRHHRYRFPRRNRKDES